MHADANGFHITDGRVTIDVTVHRRPTPQEAVSFCRDAFARIQAFLERRSAGLQRSSGPGPLPPSGSHALGAAAGIERDFTYDNASPDAPHEPLSGLARELFTGVEVGHVAAPARAAGGPEPAAGAAPLAVDGSAIGDDAAAHFQPAPPVDGEVMLDQVLDRPEMKELRDFLQGRDPGDEVAPV